MSDITPHLSGTEGGGGANFVQLAARTVRLASAALALRHEMAKLQRHMERNSTTSMRVAELAGQAEIDPTHTAMIQEVGRAYRQVAAASGELARTADQVEQASREFRDAHDAQYRGLYETNQSSAYRQPKPGFFRR
ncbi:conjugal transfer protein TraB [Kitasatospora sp. NPDC087315]|uniref:conjugal transfer protein TraB n=1 Tax=Kitasatospora sp. NPDC087315 TaxID=3364069 RepID=UPI00380369F7